MVSNEPTVSSPLNTPRDAPDRNLALELVRVTEAASMAAARWVGRGDKNGADGAAVERDAAADQHRVDERHRGHRRGREGRGPDAVQRRARSATAPARSATSPSTRSTAPGWPPRACPTRSRSRGPPARHDVRPVGGVLHGEAGHRARGGRRRSTSTRRVAENIRRGGQGQGLLAARTSPSSSWTGRGTTSWSRRSARPAPGSSSSSTATWPGAIMAAREGTGIDLMLGIGGTPEGIIAACAHQVRSAA